MKNFRRAFLLTLLLGVGLLCRAQDAATKYKVSGSVIVAVKIDKSGNVIAATARCGHPILQNTALRAAYESKFRETSSEIVGNIFYNFMPE